MVHLFDLTPEIFADIIHLFVCDVGFACAAWLRTTCSGYTYIASSPRLIETEAFDQTIYDDIISRHHIDTLEGVS